MIPSSLDRLFVNGALGGTEVWRAGGRHVGLRAVQPDVTLALLLGVVEGMGVQERPQKLTADVLEAEFKMSVLVDSVMAAKKRSGTNHHELLLSHFVRVNDAG